MVRRRQLGQPAFAASVNLQRDPQMSGVGTRPEAFLPCTILQDAPGEARLIAGSPTVFVRLLPL